jgi:hypothetical protein
MQMKLLEIIIVGSDITKHLLITHSPPAKYLWKNENTMGQQISYSDFNRAYNSARREVSQNTLIQVWYPTHLDMLIYMCLNET